MTGQVTKLMFSRRLKWLAKRGICRKARTIRSFLQRWFPNTINRGWRYPAQVGEGIDRKIALQMIPIWMALPCPQIKQHHARYSQKAVMIRRRAKAGLLDPMRNSRSVFLFCCRRQDRCIGIYVWQDQMLFCIVVLPAFLRFSTLWSKNVALRPKTHFRFCVKPLVSKDSLVLKIS